MSPRCWGWRSCARKRTEGEKESKKLIEFHHGLSVYPSLPPPYTHVGACTLCGGDAEGLRVYRCSRNTSTSMEKAGIRARICVCVCILESSRRHTYAGHFRCDGVINGN